MFPATVCFPADTQSQYLTLNILSSTETNWIIKAMKSNVQSVSKQQNNKQLYNITISSAFPVPAVDHNWPREGWIDRLDLFEELEHADG